MQARVRLELVLLRDKGRGRRVGLQEELVVQRQRCVRLYLVFHEETGKTVHALAHPPARQPARACAVWVPCGCGPRVLEFLLFVCASAA